MLYPRCVPAGQCVSTRHRVTHSHVAHPSWHVRAEPLSRITSVDVGVFPFCLMSIPVVAGDTNSDVICCCPHLERAGGSPSEKNLCMYTC